MFGYPVSLELTGRAAVVIGEGAVAEGKVEPLLAAGARVTVIATGPAARLEALERHPMVAVARRPWRPSDLDGATVCVAARTDPATNAAIHREGRARGVLVNVMDDVPHCDFAAPAVVRRGDLTISVSTGGRSPALARRLRIELEERFGPEWETVIDVLGRAREDTLPALPDMRDRARRWEAALDLVEVERLVRAGRPDEARRRLNDRLLDGAAPPAVRLRALPAPAGEARRDAEGAA
jgi:precorrin-2 dehydrogenase / sirohydrochlorin ferrochelatase